MSKFEHKTVLLSELVMGLHLRPNDIAIDCTAGGGGHTDLMLKSVGEKGHILALDQDQLAINNLEDRFISEIKSKRLSLHKTPFSKILELTNKLELTGKISGVAADIGVSSPQLDLDERGFSFMKEGPLDMRMDQSTGLESAADVVMTRSKNELVGILKDFGEEPKAPFIADAIIAAREEGPITTTTQLAEIIKGAIHYKKQSRKHPATKSFQALRIYVNNELDELKQLLEDAFTVLKPGGRLAIISFHSLEDRMVKKAFKKFADNGLSHLPRDLPLTAEQMSRMSSAKAKIIKPFPITPTKTEVDENPRSRSAKLRVIEKL